ncbi:glycosyltransferase family 2 protein [Paraburkholderia megapolitana]|uniref:glycosyltransferase family 2 protein n=1 Tax=Paraburkholderia megapolitana TaxID=420953 RepID=UPI0038BD6AF7
MKLTPIPYQDTLTGRPMQRRSSHTDTHVATPSLDHDVDASTLGALVVLYRPTDQQLLHVAGLRAHCASLLAVDNSPDARPEIPVMLNSVGIDYLHNANHGGIAGAYNRGLARLFAQGATAVALFDQDSRASDNFFAIMQASCARLGTQAFAIGPQIYDENAERFLPQMYSNGFTVRTLDVQADGPLQRCSFLLSSGAVISRLAYEQLGAFTEALFIDHVDTEYSLRALKRGVPFYLDPNLVLRHRIGEKRTHRFAFWQVTSMNHPAFRRYYMARNAMYLCRQYLRSFPVAIVPNLITLWQVVQVALFEQDKLTKLLGIGCGIVDGMRGRLGPLDQARPRLAARFGRSRR